MEAYKIKCYYYILFLFLFSCAAETQSFDTTKEQIRQMPNLITRYQITMDDLNGTVVAIQYNAVNYTIKTKIINRITTCDVFNGNDVPLLSYQLENNEDNSIITLISDALNRVFLLTGANVPGLDCPFIATNRNIISFSPVIVQPKANPATPKDREYSAQFSYKDTVMIVKKYTNIPNKTFIYMNGNDIPVIIPQDLANMSIPNTDTTKADVVVDLTVTPE